MSKNGGIRQHQVSARSTDNCVVATSASGKQDECNNAALIIDCKFAESAVRFEASQTFQQALSDWQKVHSAVTTGELERLVQPDDCSTLDAICRQYGHTAQSQASPLERWATLTTYDAEVPLHAKICMEEVGVSVGSLESVKIRAQAAKAITCGIKTSFTLR